MKVILQDNNTFVLAFQKDDEVFEGLISFLKESSISACSFTGIGACNFVELGFYNINIKDYKRKIFAEGMEIVSFVGNGAVNEGQPVLHAHGIFGKNDFSLIGGHVFRMVVAVTFEITLVRLQGYLQRGSNLDFNLNLLS